VAGGVGRESEGVPMFLVRADGGALCVRECERESWLWARALGAFGLTPAPLPPLSWHVLCCTRGYRAHGAVSERKGMRHLGCALRGLLFGIWPGIENCSGNDTRPEHQLHQAGRGKRGVGGLLRHHAKVGAGCAQLA
jgi:hypothetical protein